MELNNYEREHLSKLRIANAACTVLMKRNGKFPLGQPGKLALYGSGARHTIKGGTGSGEVNGRFFTTVEQGLQDAGFAITTGAWLDGYDKVLQDAQQAFRKRMKKEAKEHRQQVMIYAMGRSMPEPEYDLPMDGDGDTAVYVLSRISGEGSDRQPVKGDILLTDTEIRDILALDRKYSRFMLVLNVGGPVDLTPVKKVSNILLLGQLGTETGAVLADILLGRSVPSGKLAATWAAWEDYCHIGEECELDDTRYKEGIYVGYRYFDTVRKEPLFPFGFGLGYTDFTLTPGRAAAEGSRISLPVTVENTGKYKGREVVQIYLSAPVGEIDRPMQELAAFQKTKELAPGESEAVELCFDLTDMACYDADRACYLLEEGDYLLRVGNSSRETMTVAVIHLAEEAVTRKVRNACGNPDFADWKPEYKAERGRPEKMPVIEFVPEDIKIEEIRFEQTHPVETLAEKLTEEELIALNVGAFDPKAGLASIIGSASLSVPGAAGETVRVRGLPSLIMADGPAGLRLARSYYRNQKGIHVIGSTMPESIAAYLPAPVRFLLSRQPKLKAGTKIRHQYCTAIPIGMSVAQSWDPEYARLCGDVVGAEMERFGIHLWLAPALNIYRTIRCGRNFEYYSEDPLVSGKMAAGITHGVQKHAGCGVTIKHFAANNQETNRYNSNSIVSERAMREIYLKGFEIAIRESDPAAVMTSYNLLNGVHTSQHRGLLEDILRCEFGFGGIVMTDWVTGGSILSKNAKHPVPHAGLVASAGGDLFMPGSKKEIREITEALHDGRVSTEQLRINASRVIRSTRRLTGERRSK